MGHTVHPMRWVIYNKMSQFKRLVKSLREPERSIGNELIENVYQNISTITHANPLPRDIEKSMIFSMLLQEKRKTKINIEDLSLLIFSILIKYKKKNFNESDIHRLLYPRR
jgi:hypothetical protein